MTMDKARELMRTHALIRELALERVFGFAPETFGR